MSLSSSAPLEFEPLVRTATSASFALVYLWAGWLLVPSRSLGLSRGRFVSRVALSSMLSLSGLAHAWRTAELVPSVTFLAAQGSKSR